MRSDTSLGLGFVSVGAGLAALGGLEKVILYAEQADRAGSSMEALRNLIPDAIWNITNITLWSGVLFMLVGLYFMLRRTFALWAAQVKESNERFESEHNGPN